MPGAMGTFTAPASNRQNRIQARVYGSKVQLDMLQSPFHDSKKITEEVEEEQQNVGGGGGGGGGKENKQTSAFLQWQMPHRKAQ